MVTRKFVINNKCGLHARPASLLVQTANQFKSNVVLIHKNEKANCKSIMGVMMLALTFGTPFEIEVAGDDEALAMDAIVELVEGNLRGKFENS